MKVVVFTALVACLISSFSAEDVRLTDLDPNEASQLIESKDQSLKYAPKVDTNVPAVRVLGKDAYNVLEDIYLANQYHGQDGVGGYLYGYSVPDIAKTEKKKAGGDLRGAYNYITGDGQEIKVEYWDDGTGFHQVDNVPRVLPQQIEDTPEVKAAKAEHARIWQEQAIRNSQAPADPNAYDSHSSYSGSGYTQYSGQSQPAPGPSSYSSQGQYNANPYPSQSQYVQSGPPPPGALQPQPYASQPQGAYAAQPQGHASQQQASYAAQPQPAQPQAAYGAQPQASQPEVIYTAQPKAAETQGGYSAQPLASATQPQAAYAAQPQAAYAAQPQSYAAQPQGYPAGSANSGGYSGQYSGKQQAYAAGPGGYGQTAQQGNQENPEENGPPKGFFYSFDYPVGIIVQNQGRALQKRDEINAFYDKNKAALQSQLQNHGDYRAKRAVPVYIYYA